MERNEFVWVDGLQKEKNATCLFYLELSEQEGTLLEMELSAVGPYQCFLNGELVLFGPVRAAKGYVRPDKGEFILKAGKNTLGVLVNDYHVATFSYVKQSPFFYCRLKANGRTYSAMDFQAYDYCVRVQNVQRFSYQRGFAEFYRMEHDMKSLLLRPYDFLPQLQVKPVPSLDRLKRRIPSFEEKKEQAERIGGGRFTIDSKRALWKDRSISQVGNLFEGYPYEELEECLTDTVGQFSCRPCGEQKESLLTGDYSVLDFGRNISGFVVLELTALQDTNVYLTFDELLDSNGMVDFTRMNCCNVIKWELKKGEYRLISLEPYTMRYIQLFVSEGELADIRVSMRRMENPDAYRLSFWTEDKKAERILKAAQNTLAQNAVDLFMDCPSRERSGWINDIFFTRKSAEILMGNTWVEKNSLENYALCGSQKSLPEGMIPMCYPAEHLNGEYIPNCAIWYVIIACEYCLKTGEKQFAQYIEPQIRGILTFFESYENEYGFLEDLQSWVFIEWSQANSREFVKGVNFPTNMMYYRMLCAVSTLYGDRKLKERAEKLKTAIEAWSFNGSFFEDNRIRENGELKLVGHVSEACQYHAFFFDIADSVRYPELYRKLVEEFVPSREKESCYPNIDKANIITGLMMRETILIENGRREQAIRETEDIFYRMAERTDTLWENVTPTASCNHGCASYAAYLLVRSYTGLSGFVQGKPVFDEGDFCRDCELQLSSDGIGILHVIVKDGIRRWEII